jgi:hypothetical protein
MSMGEHMDSAQQPAKWIADAQQRLIDLFDQKHGWGYKPGGAPSVESTALACLALQANRLNNEGIPYAFKMGARWLASLQQHNGAIGIMESIPYPEWPTPNAILVWAGDEEFRDNANRAASWLLARKGAIFPNEEKVIGHDTTIVGWPWNAEAHSWIEPTAMAILALRRQGLGNHTRTQEGLRLISNRAIPTGGWNYGNSLVYGTALRPQPSTTGIALTALSGMHRMDSMISSACTYLESMIDKTLAPQSLCWALIGLSAWNRKPPDADQWLENAYELILKRGAKPPQLSYLLLAAGNYLFSLFGIQTIAMEMSQ